jgi:serine/threonine-protein kinase
MANRGVSAAGRAPGGDLVRPLSSDRAYPLAGTEGGFSPFWSPNGDELGFIVVAGNTGQIRKVPASGGQSQAVGEVLTAQQGTWNRDGIILVSQWGGGCVQCVLFQLPSAGGIPKPAHARDSEGSHRRWASFLPDGRHYLFVLVGAGVETGLYLGELDSNNKTRLSDVKSGAHYANGHVFFVADGKLVAQPFDVDRLRMAGDPVPVLEHVAFSDISYQGAFAVSEAAIVARAGVVRPLRQLTWMDRSGAVIRTLGEPADVSIGDLSPDGGRLLVTYARQAGDSGELWAWDLTRQVFAQLRSGGLDAPILPDGTRIAFRSPDGIE